ncbi:hypothetical protein TraAM80_07416 [Trypanosoma rangeli]|uniref:Uncharacterized protein n=1 Tax=Trypanosoma rangeli TaxID=5698 RepID=A0A422N5P8_TRYRA|nr:uncharacterized protein TraAM80_07416 [Trypanosoma rangeli]RNF00762.1 hypothetical protein TraAM80_07416 [Trypanosoma rangeli]|eukprot:RNF00762.1 hypothetical protein TraAM80_07416 [Trypanosoma rangeli]
MPPKRIVVNLSEKYGDIRIPHSLLPGVNPVAYTEQAVLFVAPPPVERGFEWGDALSEGEASAPWEPAPPLDEKGTARASLLAYDAEPLRSPVMRARHLH